MEQAVLKPIQEKLISLVVREPGLKDFYLTGGTALAAYYLQHRLSDDLDFFTFEKPDTMHIARVGEEFRTALNASEVRFQRLYDRNQFLFRFPDAEELKIEFSHYPFRQFEKPRLHDGLRVDSLRDIAANKLMTMVDRFDPKDFVDLFFILKERELKAVRRDAEQKFGVKMGPVFLGSELAKAHRIEALPTMLKQITIQELKDFFTKQAKALGPEVLQ